MKFYFKLLATLVVLFFLSVNIEAQVAIGSGKPAVPGALLQLKQDENEGANSTKGLLLPRVQLTSHDLDVFNPDSTETNDMYIGLTVWNVRGVGDICRGVNVWTGTRWESFFKMKDLTHYDPSTGILTDHEGNSYPTGEFGRAGRWMTVNLRTMTSPGSCENVYFPGELTNADFSTKMYLRVAHYPNGSLSEGKPIQPATWTKEQGMLYSWALASNGKGGPDGNGNEDNLDGSGANIEEESEQKVQRQGICPKGWHLPSYTEWQDLFAVLHEDAESKTDTYANYSTSELESLRGGGTTAKSKIALRPAAAYNPKGASKAATEGGFDVLFVGTKTANTILYGNEAIFWTASTSNLDINENKAAVGTIFRPAYTNKMDVTRSLRTFLYSVRCKQD